MKISNHVLHGENDEVSFVKSPNYSLGFSPIYLIIHYTAGTTASGAVSWFKNKDSQASSHLIIDRDGSIVQMVPFNRRAWHAGKSKWGNLENMNQYSISIELVNAGKLRKNFSGQWVNWSNTVITSAEVTVAQHKDESAEAGWHEYTEAQLETVTKVSMVLHKTYKFTDILGHDDVSPGRKIDPGPLFPLSSLRSLALGRL